MIDDRALRRLLEHEGHRLNLGFVDEPAWLSTLLSMPEPHVLTRAGERYRFDPAVLGRVAHALSPLTRANLRLPMTAHLSHELPDDVFFDDAAAQEALAQLGLSGGVRDGRLWVGRARVELFLQQFPRIVQFLRR